MLFPYIAVVFIRYSLVSLICTLFGIYLLHNYVTFHNYFIVYAYYVTMLLYNGRLPVVNVTQRHMLRIQKTPTVSHTVASAPVCCGQFVMLKCCATFNANCTCYVTCFHLHFDLNLLCFIIILT